MAVKPGEMLTWEVELQSNDTFEDLPGRDIQIMIESETVDAYRPVPNGTGITNEQGEAVISFPAPTLPGKYKYKASWKGDLIFAKKMSDADTIEVA